MFRHSQELYLGRWLMKHSFYSEQCTWREVNSRNMTQRKRFTSSQIPPPGIEISYTSVRWICNINVLRLIHVRLRIGLENSKGVFQCPCVV